MFNDIIKAAIAIQNVEYFAGNHDNQGASIDVLNEMKTVLSDSRNNKNKKAQKILDDIAFFDVSENYALKFVKPLSSAARSKIRNATIQLIRFSK